MLKQMELGNSRKPSGYSVNSLGQHTKYGIFCLQNLKWSFNLEGLSQHAPAYKICRDIIQLDLSVHGVHHLISDTVCLIKSSKVLASCCFQEQPEYHQYNWPVWCSVECADN